VAYLWLSKGSLRLPGGQEKGRALSRSVCGSCRRAEGIHYQSSPSGIKYMVVKEGTGEHYLSPGLWIEG
jgi:hypothetical protein